MSLFGVRVIIGVSLVAIIIGSSFFVIVIIGVFFFVSSLIS